jgi:hypothetical protein
MEIFSEIAREAALGRGLTGLLDTNDRQRVAYLELIIETDLDVIHSIALKLNATKNVDVGDV